MHPNSYQIVILLSYLSVTLFSYWLEWLNLRHLRKYGALVPPEFEGSIDSAALEKARDYTVEKSRFGIIESVFGDFLAIIFLFGGLIDIYNNLIAGLGLPFVLSGTLFFLLLIYAKTMLSIPFDLYGTFRIENKYGFNTMSARLWIVDFVKSQLLTTILFAIVCVAALSLIRMSPDHWWFIVWLFFLVFSLFVMYLSPYVIEPLFHKFTPLGDETLEDSIREVLNKAGIRISRVFQMDASKRSRHTNAYFTGIGSVKRIVLFDTLLQKFDRDEIVSVLAHEAGHWKKKHVLKSIILTEVMSLIGLYVSYRVIKAGFIGSLFNIRHDTLYADLLILAFIGGIITVPLTPLATFMSRRHEREADRFGVEMTGNAEAAATALIKLSKDNLSNLHPHPLYAAFHYSHPPVVERVREIRALAHAPGSTGNDGQMI
ncbi:MAG TPA: M48 family metallopeptidase [Thermodesulfovibrionales bacterium]|nr:M48 family metallopeptidase [Thermodesulfovibrionales bacterium]